jgi:iron complex transport system substrate-binding protein
MAPNVTETVFALGAGERVIAVTNFCTYPPEARRKPRVGGYFNPNLERIVALEPDLVLMQTPIEKVVALCRERGVEWLAVGMSDLASVCRGIELLGDRLGLRDEARRLRSELESGLDNTSGRAAGFGMGRPRVRVFLCTGRAPGTLSGLGTIGPGGFLAEIIEIAGGENVFADAVTQYPQVSKEALMKRAPEVIVEARPGSRLDEAGLEKLRREWSALSSVPAVRDGRVHVLTDDFLLVPGPRLVRTARLLAELFHPGAFPETFRGYSDE